MSDKWSSERLDDLNRRVENGFNRVYADLRGIRGEMNSRFEHVEVRFEHIDQQFDALQRTMLQVGGGVIAALIGVIAALIATQL